jgi:hypothetical protein
MVYGLAIPLATKCILHTSPVLSLSINFFSEEGPDGKLMMDIVV